MMEARGNVTEYRAFVLHDANNTTFDGCNASMSANTSASRHFIRLNLPANSSYYIAVVAFTAAGCNSTPPYNPIFIPARKRGVHFFLLLFCQFNICFNRI